VAFPGPHQGRVGHLDLTHFIGQTHGLPPRYFPFYSWGDGTISALDLEHRDEHGECPVATCHDGLFKAAPIEVEASSFADFFLARLRDELG
jgi:hypothetical protein